MQMEGNDFEKEVGYIAKYYKEGLFNSVRALRKIKPVLRKVWTLPRIAAASCIIIVLGATAGLLIKNSYYSEKPTETIQPEVREIPMESISKVIDFDDTPLPVVIDQINIVYNVEITNIPTNADNYRLSLHYEGNAEDLIESINEILGINLEIEP